MDVYKSIHIISVARSGLPDKHRKSIWFSWIGTCGIEEGDSMV